MDDFGIDRQELTGALISLEFGTGGRIQQLWVGDPAAPQDSDEFQFVAPPLMMGEETSEDYFPGTILLGARTSPNAPWIVSRNTRAETISDDEDTSTVSFRYDFSFLDDIRTTGKFYEIQGIIPQIAWDIEITNSSRRSIEIGELGFPLALNNVLEGFPPTDRGVRELWNDRVYVHKYLGGSASYVHAQRMTGRPPGLVVFPGGDTRWEFFNHVPASLNTPYRWEGIPVVYVHSQAAIEREGWAEWFCGHTAIVLEPGERREYQMRFAAVDRNMPDGLSGLLAACGRPAVKLFPAAISPVDVGIAVEVTGTTPTRFVTDVAIELETDSDEEGGFCFVKPTRPAAVRLLFEDTLDRESEAHLLFIEPIGDLIRKRAAWILANQVVSEAGDFKRAILAAEISGASAVTDPDAFRSPFGIESSLADALFLAEKNTIYPVQDEIDAVEDYLRSFVEERLQNPGDGSVGCILPDTRGVAVNYGRAQVYPLVFNLYHAMARCARSFGMTDREPVDYLQRAAKSVAALFAHAHPTSLHGAGVPLMSYVHELIRDLREGGLKSEGDSIARLVERRDIEIARRRYPFYSNGTWNTTGYEETFAVARRRGNEELEERALRCANAARSLSADWWWYCSDKRWPEEVDGTNPAIFDKGELCLGPTTVANSAMFFKTLDRDYAGIDEAAMRLAFGGMMAPWALIREDGAAGMGFCPDAASKHFGVVGVTGDIGLSLFHYLREAAAYVLPGRFPEVATFGCHFESESADGRDYAVIRPWDGVGRRVVVRQLGLEVLVEGGQIVEVRVDSRKRHASVSLHNHSDQELSAALRVKGLWGGLFEVGASEVRAENGELRASITLPPCATIRTDIRVKT